MRSIRVETGKPYTVLIGNKILENAGKEIAMATSKSRVMIVSDDVVFPLYSKGLTDSLDAEKIEYSSFVFKNGEAQKSFSTLEKCLEKMAAEHFTRGDAIVALGGGVVGDLAGLAAALYARGIKYVQIPTTLLAAVDSSVGGKTAIDLAHGKNLCGAFHQPSLVICDIDTLKTLKDENFSDGLAEMLKYGVICDSDLFERVENYRENDLEELIARCVEIKRDIVSIDEFDNGKRMLLNLGHTVGHAVEAASNFEITHGHAVAIGMAIITKAAEKKGFCKEGTYQRLCRALEKCALPSVTKQDTKTLASLTLLDKKSSGDTISLILPREIGKSEIYKLKRDAVCDFIEAGR